MIIKNRLKELNLSQSKASRLADMPQSSFNQIVNNKLYPCPAWRKRISAVLRISEDELFSGYEIKK